MMEIYDKLILRTPLFSINNEISQKLFLEALYIASPGLYNEYIRLRLNDNIPFDQLDKPSQKVMISYFKYLQRAKSRPTPYGLFAAISGCHFSQEPTQLITLPGTTGLQRATRIDMNVLCSLAQELVKSRDILEILTFYPNQTIYHVGDRLRYIEYFYNKYAKRTHKISEVDSDEYLLQILELAGQGISFQTAVAALTNDGIDLEDAESFITNLIENQLLISSLEPSLVGPFFFDQIFSQIVEGRQKSFLGEFLSNIRKELELIDTKYDDNFNSYTSIYETLSETFNFQIHQSALLQVDLSRKLEYGNINNKVKHSLLQAINFLNRITPSFENRNLINFKENFQQRFEDLEVRLLFALDPELGIGYPIPKTNGQNPLIDDIKWEFPTDEFSLKWDSVESALLKMLIKNESERKKIIHLSESDFPEIDHAVGKMPNTMSVVFELPSNDDQAYLKYVSGKSAAALLGRFSHCNEDVESILKYINTFEDEYSNDFILAEINHLPEARTGNILARKKFRKAEIPYLAGSGSKSVDKISINDLYVFIQNEKVFLKSKTLGKLVIPKLGNAHNYSADPSPIYQFLADLETQFYSKTQMSFSWGSLQNSFSFFPRVVYKNVILYAATWRISKEEIRDLFKSKTQLGATEALMQFITRLELPEKFYLLDYENSDNLLLINSKEEISVHVFYNEIEKKQNFLLKEDLYTGSHPSVTDGKHNRYYNEFIATLLNREYNFPSVKIDNYEFNVPKKFHLGDEWLYFKIYGGEKTLEYILLSSLYDIVQGLIREAYATQWFFIRYSDPKDHIRLRIKISHKDHISAVIELIRDGLDQYLKANLLEKIDISTYDREIIRYGEDFIDKAESLFETDSNFTCKALNYLVENNQEDSRWQIAPISINAIFQDFNVDLSQRLRLMSIMGESFLTEFDKSDKNGLKISIDKKYRLHKASILRDLTSASGSFFDDLVKKRSNDNLQILKEYDIKQTDISSVYRVLISLIHMNMNRLFLNSPRKNEAVIYNMMVKIYQTMIKTNYKD